jgi:tetratricopeptide (TPR) repeat protein
MPTYLKEVPVMRFVLAVFTSMLVVTSAAAQSNKVPKRPNLPANSDTNDPGAYFAVGLAALDNMDAHKAADAFYWASRLDPNWADPLYARRIALLLQEPPRLMRYMTGDRRVITSKDMRQIDSLQYRALMLDPFVYRKLDRRLLTGYFKFVAEHEGRRMGDPRMIDDATLHHWIGQFMVQADPSWRAWGAYTSGDLQTAIRLYGEAIKFEKEKNRSGLYADRSRAYYLVGQYDSALVDMKQAIEKLRKPEKDEIVYFYESKALYEHSVGKVLERRKDYDGAREAYGRALQEDLSYYPAHLGTASVALVTGDTAGAIASMDLAVQVKPDDPGLRVSYGVVLQQSGKYADAEAQLRKAIELEPLYAMPYFALGQVLEAAGNRAGAVEQYRLFLERASRNHPRRSATDQRIQTLSAGSSDAQVTR